MKKPWEGWGVLTRWHKECLEMNNPDMLFDNAVLSVCIASCCFVYISPDEEGYPRLQVIDGSNADFQGKAGLHPRIVREAVAGCCEWCMSISGSYRYPNVPNDVYRSITGVVVPWIMTREAVLCVEKCRMFIQSNGRVGKSMSSA